MLLILDKESNLFYCKSDFHEKHIPKEAGFRWNVSRKQWESKDVEKAKTLVEYADAPTKEFILGQMKVRKETFEKSRAKTTEFNVVAPEGLSYYPFQKAGIEFCVKNNKVLLADSMGLGKSIQVLGLINALSLKKILIVCPASLKLNWQREAEKWLINKKLTIEVLNSKTKKSKANIQIVNYDILSKLNWLKETAWDLLACDEAHYVKSPKSKRSKEVYALTKKNSRVVYMTGTPIMNRPSELYYLVNNLGFEIDWFEYMKRYADARQGPFGWDFSGASNLDELQERLRSTIMIRRLKEEVLDEIPSKIRQVIEFEGSSAVSKEKLALRDIEKEKNELSALIEKYQKEDDKELYKETVEKLREATDLSFGLIARLRHETALAKVPQAITFLEDSVENGKVVVFAHHHDVIDALYDGFKNCAVKFTGQESLQARQTAVDEFQNNPKIKMFIGSLTAANVGITLTKAESVVFVELDWVPATMSQAEDRVARIGKKGSVLVQHLVVNDSIDASLAKTLVRKQNVIDQALDEDVEKQRSEPLNKAVLTNPSKLIEAFKNKKHISFSEVYTFAKCPHKHNLVYVQKVKQPDTVHTIFGRAVHKSIEDRFVHGHKTSNWLSMCKTIAKWIKTHPIDKYSGPLNYKEWIKAALDNYKNVPAFLEKHFGKFKVIGCEEKIFTYVKDIYTSFFGFIDLLIEDEKGDIHIIDFKTSNKSWNEQKTSDVEKRYQVLLYKKFLCDSKFLDKNKIRTHYIILKRTYDEATGSIDLISETSSDDKVNEAYLWFVKNAKGIATNLKIKQKMTCDFCICGG